MKNKNKQIVIFDLDGTLTPSKAPMDEEMSDLLCGLLTKKKVAVIGGGAWKQFEEQFLRSLRCREELLERLFLFPTSAAQFYRDKGGRWAREYADELTEKEREEIKTAINTRINPRISENPDLFPKLYGEQVEDRGTQITFSALGQKASIPDKKAWNKKYDALRQQLAAELREALPEFEVRTGGLTSIDFTKKGIDKAYGVRQIEKILGASVSDMVFVGDALYPGGNDEAAKQTGIECVEVKGPEETKKIIEGWLT